MTDQPPPLKTMSDVSARPADILVDARGHKCPAPTLRLRRALEALKPGDCVHILADDPLAQIDLPHFVSSAGHVLERLDVKGERIEAIVRKVSPA